MSITNDQLSQTATIKDLYRPLNTSKGEIRLLSFESTARHDPLKLNLHYASLNDWKPDYVSFRDQNTSIMSSSQMSEAWSNRLDATWDEMYDTIARFTWGDYICLSYTWGDCAGENVTIFLDGIEMVVSKHLGAALQDLRETLECRLGMKVWVDALCINQTDSVDRNAHVLLMKNIFCKAFSVTIWTKDYDDLGVKDLSPPGERLTICDLVFRLHGKTALEEVLGVREREWGAMEDQDDQLMRLVSHLDEPVFNQYDQPDSDDEFGFEEPSLLEVVRMELFLMFRKEYWSRLWTIQELALSPTTSTVHWGESTFQLSTLLTIGDILLCHYRSSQSSDPGIWQELKLRLDLLAFITQWRMRKTEHGDTEHSLDDDSIRKLKVLTKGAKSLFPHDQVYGLLGLFPPSVAFAVPIDYDKDSADVIAQFASAVPGWNHDQS